MKFGDTLDSDPIATEYEVRFTVRKETPTTAYPAETKYTLADSDGPI